MSAYNYAGAFLLFSQGSSLEDISLQLGIPLQTLESESRQHGWKRLCHHLKLAIPTTPIEQSLALVKSNREKSLSETEPLEKEFEYIIKLNDGLRSELDYWDSQVDSQRADLGAAETDHTQNPTDESLAALNVATAILKRTLETRDTLRMFLSNPKRYKELAQGLAQVQELRYRAVGDLPNVMAGAKPEPRKALTQIVVNMPSMVSRPRQVVELQQPEPPKLP